MLINILKRLAQGGGYSNKSIAKGLGVDEKLIEQMIVQLKDLGYIEKYDMDNCSSCRDYRNCNRNCSCCPNNNIEAKIWKITEKGKTAVLM